MVHFHTQITFWKAWTKLLERGWSVLDWISHQQKVTPRHFWSEYPTQMSKLIAIIMFGTCTWICELRDSKGYDTPASSLLAQPISRIRVEPVNTSLTSGDGLRQKETRGHSESFE